VEESPAADSARRGPLVTSRSPWQSLADLSRGSYPWLSRADCRISAGNRFPSRWTLLQLPLPKPPPSSCLFPSKTPARSACLLNKRQAADERCPRPKRDCDAQSVHAHSIEPSTWPGMKGRVWLGFPSVEWIIADRRREQIEMRSRLSASTVAVAFPARTP
jgi:hypothetical protein